MPEPFAITRPTSYLSDRGATAPVCRTEHLRDAPIPVLRPTAQRIDAMAQHPDSVDLRELVSVVLDDPLMALKVVVHVCRQRGQRRRLGEPETIGQSLLLMGVPRFLGAFAGQSTVREMLDGRVEALAGLVRTLKRSHRASHFALAIALLRRDHDAEVIREAALLHEFAEALLWCHAPDTMLALSRRRQLEPHREPAVIERELLGIELNELRQQLMQAWGMPGLLVQLEDDLHAEHPRVRNVSLAVRLATHVHEGWDTPEAERDVAEIAALLSQAPCAVRARLEDLDLSALPA